MFVPNSLVLVLQRTSFLLHDLDLLVLESRPKFNAHSRNLDYSPELQPLNPVFDILLIYW